MKTEFWKQAQKRKDENIARAKYGLKAVGE
jgi:hypothetical protein